MVFQGDREESLHGEGVTFAVTVVPHDDRGKEGIAIVRKYSFFDFVIGEDEGLCV